MVGSMVPRLAQKVKAWACKMGDRKRGNECMQIKCPLCHAHPLITHQIWEEHMQKYDKGALSFWV